MATPQVVWPQDNTLFVVLPYYLGINLLVVLGQTVSTEILGLVTDPAGAVVPGATITVKRVATGDVRRSISNDTGNYAFPLLEVGEYEVTCSAPGFKVEVRRRVLLELQQKFRLDFQMQIGQQQEMVEVTGTGSMLRTEDATLGSVVEHRRVVDLPLNGRNFGHLATLTPGVTIGIARMGLDGQGGRIIAARIWPFRPTASGTW
jgi:hypothetical protein